ncbi:MAG TPA: hypothetical protein V6C91_11700, partial [Coleofasciculaceae cyanobacterium]
IILTLCWARLATAYHDIYDGGIGQHSTFHYELTRTLVRAAGFSAQQAEEIAVINEALDQRSFTGYQDSQGHATHVRITNTRRLSGYGTYWHFPRRDCTNSHGVSYPFPASATTCNTCEYFRGTIDPCPNGVPELNGIDQWALYGNASAVPVVSSYSVNGGRLTTVLPQSIEALGIFLHALADSYSHQYCMQTTQLRTHDPSPPECNHNTWHLDMEFGIENDDLGVPYTISAGQAVFQNALLFISLNGGGGSRLWTDEQANNFIMAYAREENAQIRAQMAIDAYNNL